MCAHTYNTATSPSHQHLWLSMPLSQAESVISIFVKCLSVNPSSVSALLWMHMHPKKLFQKDKKYCDPCCLSLEPQTYEMSLLILQASSTDWCRDPSYRWLHLLCVSQYAAASPYLESRFFWLGQSRGISLHGSDWQLPSIDRQVSTDCLYTTRNK